MNKNVWEQYISNEKKEQQLTNFCEGYKKYISDCKTERECVKVATAMAQAKGYKNLTELIKNNTPLNVGDKVYATYMDKCMLLFKVGKNPLEKGLNIVDGRCLLFH